MCHFNLTYCIFTKSQEVGYIVLVSCKLVLVYVMQLVPWDSIIVLLYWEARYGKDIEGPGFQLRAGGRTNQRKLLIGGAEFFFFTAIIFTLFLFENYFNYSQWHHCINGEKLLFHSSWSAHLAWTLIYRCFSNLPLRNSQLLNFPATQHLIILNGNFLWINHRVSIGE